MLFANTSSAKVEDGVVVATGTFAQMIAPASPFREGFPEARAKAEFGVYRAANPSHDPALETLVATAPYYDAQADAVYSATVSPLSVEQRKPGLRALVNAERDRRWPGTVDADVRGDASLVVPVDARSDVDLRNIQAVATVAQIAAGTPGATLDFRGANDVTYELTPAESVALAWAVQAHVSAHYAAAWALKDDVAAADTEAALDAIDPTDPANWP